MNESPKYVVSSTLQNVGWSNSTILRAYDAGTIRALKQRIEGDNNVSGSGTLVRAMLADGLNTFQTIAARNPVFHITHDTG